MNAYNQRIFRLLAIAVSVMALFSYKFFPEKRYLVTAASDVNSFIYGSELPDGRSAALWLNESERKFRCIYPEGVPDYIYYCSFNLSYEFGENTGLDLSRYGKIKLSIEIPGNKRPQRGYYGKHQ